MRRRQNRASGQLKALISLAAVLLAGSATAQERVSIEQVQANAARSATSNPATAIQESDYILGSQSGISLLSPNVVAPASSAAMNQARALQVGVGNVSTVDQTGYGNLAIQSVTGFQNSVTQTQSGSNSQSRVTVDGNFNVVGTQQEKGGGSAIISVQGNNNAITAQQLTANPQAISITTQGNGANLTVKR